MQTVSLSKNAITIHQNHEHTNELVSSKIIAAPMVFGLHKSLIKFFIWFNVLMVALYYFKGKASALKTVKKLKALRNDFRGKHPVLKYARVSGKYYFTFSAPGWPSFSFNKFVLNNIKKLDVNCKEVTLDNIIFAITKKCGYQCEHCFEWDALNRPENLSRENILSVIHSFQFFGITQVQLSGGEPLNRLNDIIYILENIQSGTDVWLYTSGYHFTAERAALLKQKGLTGIAVSLDHWIPELHDAFRGKRNAFEWAKKAVAHAKSNGLVVCLSLCATKEFINETNLMQYGELAKQWGVSFIQILEPRAVGHYARKEVLISETQVSTLENFFTTYNYNKSYRDYPTIVYHGFYSRRVSCGGAANHYVYIDTDGDVHSCPFCKQKKFSALGNNIEDNLRMMSSGGCNVFLNPSPKEKVI